MAYQTYRNLPPLAGLCSMEDAQRVGMAVEECVRRLKRFHYAFRRLHEIFTALTEQLGLKLEAEREMVEVLVITSIDRPTEN